MLGDHLEVLKLEILEPMLVAKLIHDGDVGSEDFALTSHNGLNEEVESQFAHLSREDGIF